MKRRRAVRAGVWLTIYAAGGSLVGVVGFGTLWQGIAHMQWARAIMGLGLLLLGLDRAAAAMQASTQSRRAVAALRSASGPTDAER